MLETSPPQHTHKRRIAIYHTDDDDPSAKLASTRGGFLKLLHNQTHHTSLIITTYKISTSWLPGWRSDLFLYHPRCSLSRKHHTARCHGYLKKNPNSCLVSCAKQEWPQGPTFWGVHPVLRVIRPGLDINTFPFYGCLLVLCSRPLHWTCLKRVLGPISNKGPLPSDHTW